MPGEPGSSAKPSKGETPAPVTPVSDVGNVYQAEPNNSPSKSASSPDIPISTRWRPHSGRGEGRVLRMVPYGKTPFYRDDKGAEEGPLRISTPSVGEDLLDFVNARFDIE